MTHDTVRLQLDSIHYRRAERHILKGIDWRVREGEHWAVVGPNGCGKTSLMMVATGYEPSSAGEVYLVSGYIREITLPAVRREVGFVSSQLTEVMAQHRRAATGLETVLSGRYASLGIYERPTPAALAEARRTLRRLGAAHLEDVPFGKMSTGQRQICLIGRCFMARSKLMILDEPCAGLDLATREVVLRALSAACARRPNRPVVLITHHPEEIMPAITHVLLMRDGRAIAQGPKDAVLTHASLEAAYGLPLRVVRQDGRVWIVPRGGKARLRRT